jgi:hypothetical protein
MPLRNEGESYVGLNAVGGQRHFRRIRAEFARRAEFFRKN